MLHRLRGEFAFGGVMLEMKMGDTGNHNWKAVLVAERQSFAVAIDAAGVVVAAAAAAVFLSVVVLAAAGAGVIVAAPAAASDEVAAVSAAAADVIVAAVPYNPWIAAAAFEAAAPEALQTAGKAFGNLNLMILAEKLLYKGITSAQLKQALLDNDISIMYLKM